MRRLFLGGLLIAAVGCGQQAVIAPPPSDQGALDSVVMAEKPTNVVGVRDALAAADGAKVVVTGRTPGEKVKPFNSAVATFVLMAPEDLDREEIKEELDCDDAAT
jgi:hypothetical protein